MPRYPILMGSTLDVCECVVRILLNGMEFVTEEICARSLCRWERLGKGHRQESPATIRHDEMRFFTLSMTARNFFPLRQIHLWCLGHRGRQLLRYLPIPPSIHANAKLSVYNVTSAEDDQKYAKLIESWARGHPKVLWFRIRLEIVKIKL